MAVVWAIIASCTWIETFSDAEERAPEKSPLMQGRGLKQIA